MTSDKDIIAKIQHDLMSEFDNGKPALIPPGAYLPKIIEDKPKLAAEIYLLIFNYVLRRFIRGTVERDKLSALKAHIGLSAIGMYRLFEEMRRLTIYANLVMRDELNEQLALKQMMTWQHVDKKIIPKLWNACKLAYEAERVRQFEFPDDIDEDELSVPDGELSEGTFSTNAPHVKPNMLRLILCDDQLRFVIGVIFGLGILFFVLLITNIWLFTADYLVWGFVLSPITLISLVVAGYTKEFLPKILSASNAIYGSGLLVPGIIEKTKPLTILYLANMSTGMGVTCWGIRRNTISTLPVHPKRVGEMFPCVSSFDDGDGGMFAPHWADFYPRPIAWGIGNVYQINDLMLKVDKTAIKKLKECIATGVLPEGNNKILLLTDDLKPMPEKEPETDSEEEDDEGDKE